MWFLLLILNRIVRFESGAEHFCATACLCSFIYMHIGLLFYNRSFRFSPFHLKCLISQSVHTPLLSVKKRGVFAVIKQVTPVGARVKRVCPSVQAAVHSACLLAKRCILLLRVAVLYLLMILYTWYLHNLPSKQRVLEFKISWTERSVRGRLLMTRFCILSELFCINYYPM